jgi:ATP-dependent Clp protease ATP-binding subunit ClpX
VYICDECVQLCYDILHEQKNARGKDFRVERVPAPREIQAELDRYVIGQDTA